ncbi:hypothetical protein FT637_15905 [Bacillus cereus]|uniref:hypothetical protein n=1 Tax=Bacillus cereus TaxID=1396 RepID=UPI00187A314D|nr:hypothetical protein [Bacillus cereus]MBE7104477.1 hypothetical protein [Bacillus cereus]
MEKKMQLECMDNECRTVMFGHFLDGMRCVNCGGPTRERPYNPVKKQNDQSKNRGLTIQVNVDTTEALKQMKELTNVAYACVEAFEKLEKVMGRFTNKTDSLLIEVPVILNGKTIAQRVSEVADIKERF